MAFIILIKIFISPAPTPNSLIQKIMAVVLRRISSRMNHELKSGMNVLQRAFTEDKDKYNIVEDKGNPNFHLTDEVDEMVKMDDRANTRRESMQLFWDVKRQGIQELEKPLPMEEEPSEIDWQPMRIPQNVPVTLPEQWDSKMETRMMEVERRRRESHKLFNEIKAQNDKNYRFTTDETDF